MLTSVSLIWTHLDSLSHVSSADKQGKQKVSCWKTFELRTRFFSRLLGGSQSSWFVSATFKISIGPLHIPKRSQQLQMKRWQTNQNKLELFFLQRPGISRGRTHHQVVLEDILRLGFLLTTGKLLGVWVLRFVQGKIIKCVLSLAFCYLERFEFALARLRAKISLLKTTTPKESTALPT